jgi:hypothetical protein
MKSAATPAMPRCLVLRMVPCCLPQPKMHSVIARRDCDMPYFGCRVLPSLGPTLSLRLLPFARGEHWSPPRVHRDRRSRILDLSLQFVEVPAVSISPTAAVPAVRARACQWLHWIKVKKLRRCRRYAGQGRLMMKSIVGCGFLIYPTIDGLNEQGRMCQPVPPGKRIDARQRRTGVGC